jgi:hypothetical protein
MEAFMAGTMIEDDHDIEHDALFAAHSHGIVKFRGEAQLIAWADYKRTRPDPAHVAYLLKILVRQQPKEPSFFEDLRNYKG